MNGHTLAGKILAGDCDDALDAIAQAVKVRRNVAARTNISIGDVVEFTGGRQYLVGVRATVKEILHKNVRVEVIEAHRVLARKYGYGSFRCPPTLLKKVS